MPIKDLHGNHPDPREQAKALAILGRHFPHLNWLPRFRRGDGSAPAVAPNDPKPRPLIGGADAPLDD
jgi:hypothetical protein